MPGRLRLRLPRLSPLLDLPSRLAAARLINYVNSWLRWTTGYGMHRQRLDVAADILKPPPHALNPLVVPLIGVSAPTTVLSAMTAAARHSLPIKGGRALEELAQVNVVVFDKTGTLTRGEPRVTMAESFGSESRNSILQLAASAEGTLKHPAARAIVDAAEAAGLNLLTPDKVACETAPDATWVGRSSLLVEWSGNWLAARYGAGQEKLPDLPGILVTFVTHILHFVYTVNKMASFGPLINRYAVGISYISDKRPPREAVPGEREHGLRKRITLWLAAHGHGRLERALFQRTGAWFGLGTR